MAKKHYSGDEHCAEVDHVALLSHLNDDFDAWALSSGSIQLKQILNMPTCPDDVRICAWVKPFANFKPNVNPAYAWEPIITRGGRKRGRDVYTAYDWVSANITLKRGVVGAKPDKFCFWLFEFMGLNSDDEFTDMFPGSGAVTEAWETWVRQKTLFTETRG